MRLAYVVADRGVPWLGSKGASVHVRSITSALAAAGHDVVVLVARRGDGDLRPSPGVRVVPVPPEPVLERLASSCAADGDAASAALLVAALSSAFRDALLAEARIAPFDAVVERYSLWSVAGAWAAREMAAPLLLEVNAPLPEEQARFRGLTLPGLADAVRREAFATADVLLAVSREVAEGAVRNGARPERTVVLANGYDDRLFAPVQRDGGGFTVGFVGSLKPWHGVETLVEAFALLAGRVPSARLLIVGDGPSRESVERRAAELGATDRVELTGAVAHEQVPAQLARMDVAVAPYPERDGFYFSPLKLYEYMGAGLPVVASAAGQVADVVVHGESGWLVPPGDVPALASALQMLAESPDLRHELGRNAARAARDGHRWSDVAQRLAAHAEVARARLSEGRLSS